MRKRRRSQFKNRANKAVQDFFLWIIVMVCLIFLSCGGYDYYKNGNMNHTLQLAESIWHTVRTLPGRFGGSEVSFGDKVGGWLENLAQEGNYETGSGGETPEYAEGEVSGEVSGETASETVSVGMDSIPVYTGEPYVVINDNIPYFTKEEFQFEPFEYYSELDSLGRCGYAEAMIGLEIMPTEERGAIGMVKPAGWHTIKYDNIDGMYLYNRCHLIAYELAGENANERNLITGTRYMNVSGMLPFENMVARYVKNTGDRVLYRVTPVYDGEELVARGVHMEAEAVSTNDIKFNVFVFNIQPGIGIDYSNGDSWQQ